MTQTTRWDARVWHGRALLREDEGNEAQSKGARFISEEQRPKNKKNMCVCACLCVCVCVCRARNTTD